MRYRKENFVKINGMLRHKTKYMVKILSGETKGDISLFYTEEQAKAECFYLADCLNICSTYYPPAYR